MPGIADGTASCSAAGQGLYWSGSTFGCTTAYSWNLRAGWNGSSWDNTETINSGEYVSFHAEGTAGLSVKTGSDNVVRYSLDLSAGNGLTFINGQFALKSCTTSGQILTWNNDSKQWNCNNQETEPTILASGWINANGNSGSKDFYRAWSDGTLEAWSEYYLSTYGSAISNTNIGSEITDNSHGPFEWSRFLGVTGGFDSFWTVKYPRIKFAVKANDSAIKYNFNEPPNVTCSAQDLQIEFSIVVDINKNSAACWTGSNSPHRITNLRIMVQAFGRWTTL
jgi:hypothetical protein